MNLVGYVKDKERNLISVAKIGNAYAMAKRRFSQNDGSEIDPEIQAITLQAIKDQKKTLTEAITDCDALLTDLEAL